jgi:hypothetical protein
MNDKLTIVSVDGHELRNGGVMGVWDRKTRIQEMDREGVAAEFIHSGDPRASGLSIRPVF